MLTLRAAQEQSGLVPIDARALLTHVLACDRVYLIAHAGEPVERSQAEAFFALAKRRRDGEPVAYLVGEREFWGVALKVSPAVLIPRPETETLVEAALARLPRNRPLRVLDLGTGSGAIALAIAFERPHAQVVATDVSDQALAVARSNAQRLDLQNVTFVQSDWYASVSGEPYDAILANPPYISSGDAHLGVGDLRFEPRVALTPGSDGMAALNTIVTGARSRLAEGGCLIVEHGHDQAEHVARRFEACGFEALQRLRDLAGVPRVVSGRAPGRK